MRKPVKIGVKPGASLTKQPLEAKVANGDSGDEKNSKTIGTQTRIRLKTNSSKLNEANTKGTQTKIKLKPGTATSNKINPPGVALASEKPNLSGDTLNIEGLGKGQEIKKQETLELNNAPTENKNLSVKLTGALNGGESSIERETVKSSVTETSARRKPIVPGGTAVGIKKPIVPGGTAVGLKRPVIPGKTSIGIPKDQIGSIGSNQNEDMVSTQTGVGTLSNTPTRIKLDPAAVSAAAHKENHIAQKSEAINTIGRNNLNIGGMGSKSAIQKHINDYEIELQIGEVLLATELINKEQHKEVERRIKTRRSVSSSVISRNMNVELCRLGGVDMAPINDYFAVNGDMPFIDLLNFNFEPIEKEELTLDTCENLGIIIFGENERSIQIGCVNPFDETMQKLVKDLLKGMKVFFYLISADELLRFYDKQRSKR